MSPQLIPLLFAIRDGAAIYAGKKRLRWLFHSMDSTLGRKNPARSVMTSWIGPLCFSEFNYYLASPRVAVPGKCLYRHAKDDCFQNVLITTIVSKKYPPICTIGHQEYRAEPRNCLQSELQNMATRQTETAGRVSFLFLRRLHFTYFTAESARGKTLKNTFYVESNKNTTILFFSALPIAVV